jgi:hypothetical protein
MNIGHSSRLGYDDCAYDDKLKESTSALKYRLSTFQADNCDSCLSVLGPRGKYGVSTTTGDRTAHSQALTDVESVLSNRNMKKTKCRRGGVNEVNVNDYSLKHARICNDYLNPMSSKLSYPPSNYRELSINRFFDLPQNPQETIFWDGAVNTRLEARDNHLPRIPKPKDQSDTLPHLNGVKQQPYYKDGAFCPN